MEFLWLGDMTLFICFVRSSLFLPTTSPFWNQCVHGSRQRNRMFLWHSHSELWASSENNRLIEQKTGALPTLFQQVERFWVTAELRNEPVFPQLCRSWNPARRHLDGSDQLPPSSQWQSWKWERCSTLKPGGMACPDTFPHTQEDSRAHHYHILWALNSVSQSFRHCTGLSVCHVNALGWLRLVCLVAPTHTVIGCKGDGQAVRGGKVNCDLSCWGRQGSLNRLLVDMSTFAWMDMHIFSFRFV